MDYLGPQVAYTSRGSTSRLIIHPLYWSREVAKVLLTHGFYQQESARLQNSMWNKRLASKSQQGYSEWMIGLLVE